MINCKFCGKSFKRSCALKSHEKYCLFNSDRLEELFCKFCGKKCKNTNSLKNHERLCRENPLRTRSAFENADNRFQQKCSKRTIESINKGKNTYLYRKDKGIYKNYGHKHTEQTKEKLREIAINNSVGGTTYKILYEYNGIRLDSSYELRVAQSLDENGIK